MKRSHLRFALLLLLAMNSPGCGKKDEGAGKPSADKASADKTSADKPAGAAPADPAASKEPVPTKTGRGATAEPVLDIASLPAECKAFVDAIEAVSTCSQIPKPQQDSIKAGNKMLLKSMIDANEPKIVKGCLDGTEALATMRKSAGC